MARVPRPPRFPRAAPLGLDATGTASVPLVSLLARTSRLVDLLPALHQRALDVTGGACSLLFEHNPRNGVLQATSGFALDSLHTESWLPDPPEAALVKETFAGGTPRRVTDLERSMPDLAARLNTRAAWLIPLAHGTRRVGLLAVGLNGPTPAAPNAARGSAGHADAASVADAFLTALELCRLRRNEEFQRDLRNVLDEFGQSLSATLNLAAALDIFCHGVNLLFGADCTAVWLHDRRARHLVLRASSDPERGQHGTAVSAQDSHAPAALAMRGSRAEIVQQDEGAATSVVTVPLRGCRRALGTIVFEGVRVETGGALDLLDRADEIGSQLSIAIENMQLLDDVMRSRRELEHTFDSIAHLVVVFDRRGHIVHANEAFANRVGLTREEFLDVPLADFVGPDLAAWLAVQAEAPAQPAGDAPATLDIVDPVLNGPFFVTVTDLLDHERTRVGTVMVARDRTPQTRLEAEREELRKRLTQSEKLAALGQFVAGIAHELNNPLQGVLGHLELLRVTGAIPRPLRPPLQTIYREADRAAKIVRNLLVFAGSRRLARRAVSLNAVLQKVVATRQMACRAAGIEVVRHYDEKLPRIQSDPLLLHQVFLNMVINAEHAVAATGNEHGRIELTTAVTPEGDRIVATVRDTGAGLAPDVVSHIFEPFYTTKEVGQGTGLGLAIAYGIVQEHGGNILAANHPDGGALFTVELPVTSKPRTLTHD